LKHKIGTDHTKQAVNRQAEITNHGLFLLIELLIDVLRISTLLIFNLTIKLFNQPVKGHQARVQIIWYG